MSEFGNDSDESWLESPPDRSTSPVSHVFKSRPQSPPRSHSTGKSFAVSSTADHSAAFSYLKTLLVKKLDSAREEANHFWDIHKKGIPRFKFSLAPDGRLVQIEPAAPPPGNPPYFQMESNLNRATYLILQPLLDVTPQNERWKMIPRIKNAKDSPVIRNVGVMVEILLQIPRLFSVDQSVGWKEEEQSKFDVGFFICDMLYDLITSSPDTDPLPPPLPSANAAGLVGLIISSAWECDAKFRRGFTLADRGDILSTLNSTLMRAAEYLRWRLHKISGTSRRRTLILWLRREVARAIVALGAALRAETQFMLAVEHRDIAIGVDAGDTASSTPDLGPVPSDSDGILSWKREARRRALQTCEKGPVRADRLLLEKEVLIAEKQLNEARDGLEQIYQEWFVLTPEEARGKEKTREAQARALEEEASKKRRTEQKANERAREAAKRARQDAEACKKEAASSFSLSPGATPWTPSPNLNFSSDLSNPERPPLRRQSSDPIPTQSEPVSSSPLQSSQPLSAAEADQNLIAGTTPNQRASDDDTDNQMRHLWSPQQVPAPAACYAPSRGPPARGLQPENFIPHQFTRYFPTGRFPQIVVCDRYRPIPQHKFSSYVSYAQAAGASEFNLSVYFPAARKAPLRTSQSILNGAW